MFNLKLHVSVRADWFYYEFKDIMFNECPLNIEKQINASSCMGFYKVKETGYPSIMKY